jgi:hypothetical protein
VKEKRLPPNRHSEVERSGTPSRHSEVERSGTEESEFIYLEKKYMSSFPFSEGYEFRFFAFVSLRL